MTVIIIMLTYETNVTSLSAGVYLGPGQGQGRVPPHHDGAERAQPAHLLVHHLLLPLPALQPDSRHHHRVLNGLSLQTVHAGLHDN